MLAGAAAAGGDESARSFEFGFGEHRRDGGVERRAQAGRANRHAFQAVVERVVAKDFFDVGPQVGERGDHAAARLVGALREAEHPLGGVVAVVVDLFHRLGSDRGEGRVSGCPQPAVQLEQVVRHHELAGDRVGKVTVGLLDDVQRPKIGLGAPVGKVVLGTV